MNGIINVYKPAGITSFDAVSTIRKISGTKRVGHTGTLDPEAFGVLPICLGKATKVVDYIVNEFKVYKAVLKLGIVTDTYDMEGKIISEKEVNLNPENITEAISKFTGELEQIPPMYSAIKVNGKKLYELARKGIEIERTARKVNIYSINVESIDIPFVTFTVKCSKGTYIRSLCYDIGNMLGCGGTMFRLERTATGSFTKENSVKLCDLNSENISNYLMPMEAALSNYESITFDEKYEKILMNGGIIDNCDILKNVQDNQLYRVYLNTIFLGLGQKTQDKFKMSKLLI